MEVAPSPLTAVILAGGSGERLRPLTDDRPKAMVEVAGKPILFHQLDWLRRNAVARVVVACGHLHARISEALAVADLGGVNVLLSVERQKLGRGGALKLACHSAHLTGTFLAINGDLITDLDVAGLLAQHRRAGVLATIAVTPLRSPHGIVVVSGEMVSGFQEKPLLPHWISAGVYALSSDLIARLPDVGDHEEHLFPELSAAGQLGAYRIGGYWRSVDNMKDVQSVSDELLAGQAR